MQISDFVIGVMAFIATALCIFALMGDMYNINNPKSYQVDLAANNYTKSLSLVNTQLEETQAVSNAATYEVYNKITGEPNSTVSSTSGAATQSDVWSNSLLSLTAMPKYLKAFIGMFQAVGLVLGISVDNPVMQFLMVSLIFSIALTLIGIVFFRPL